LVPQAPQAILSRGAKGAARLAQMTAFAEATANAEVRQFRFVF
jgi:hypothetical protein